MIRSAILVVAASTLLASRAGAQRLSFSPQIGFYIPTERLYELVNNPNAQSDDFKLEAGPSFGARLGLWFGKRVGVEVGGSYVPTTFLLGGNTTTKQDAKLFTGTGQVVLFLIPPTSILSLYLSGGVAAVSRGGVAFTREAKTTSFGGVLGAGAGINLGGISLTVGADLLGYKADYQGSQAVSKELSQKDVNLKLGFGVPFGGSGARGGRPGGR